MNNRRKEYPLGTKVYCLAPEDWMPMEKLLAPSFYSKTAFFSRDESDLEAIRVFNTPVTAVWSSLAWKQGPIRPWLIEAEADYLSVFCRTTGSMNFLGWTERIPNSSIRRVMRFFDWQVCWPGELLGSMISKESIIQELDHHNEY
jgi:hypothetical protein